ncbi:MAG: hypothetical protein ACYC61_11720, partial [Isosphaeraceae bacterium]
MARNGVLVRFRSSLLIVARAASSRPSALRTLLVVVAAVAAPAPEAHAAGLFSTLTPRDRAQPMILSETGAPIPRGSTSHPAALIASGTVPAYLAYPLLGGEHLPSGIPTLASGQTLGQPGIGPMDLTQSDVLALNADIQASRFAIVNAPGQSFAVAFLPRYSRALAHATPPPASTSTSSSGTSTGSTNPLAALGLPTSINQWTIQGIPGSQLSKWVNTGTNELAHLSSLGLDGVTKTLRLAGLKVTPTPAGLHVAPQFLVPSSSGPTVGGPLPVPAPEPSTWLVFALALGGA